MRAPVSGRTGPGKAPDGARVYPRVPKGSIAGDGTPPPLDGSRPLRRFIPALAVFFAVLCLAGGVWGFGRADNGALSLLGWLILGAGALLLAVLAYGAGEIAGGLTDARSLARLLASSRRFRVLAGHLGVTSPVRAALEEQCRELERLLDDVRLTSPALSVDAALAQKERR